MNSFRSIDLNLLVVFSVLMSEQNLTHAGEQLGMTQSAVSHALKRLRSLYNDSLFERKSGRMLPTPKARAISPLVNQILADVQSTLPSKEVTTPEKLSLEFRINITSVYSVFYIQKLVAGLHKKAPGVTLVVTSDLLNDPAQALKNREYDLHIDLIPNEEEGSHFKALYNDEMVVVASKEHPRIANLNDITLEQYLAETHCVLVPRDNDKNVLSMFTQFPFDRKIGFKSHSFIDMFYASIATDLICLLPSTLANALSETHEFNSFKTPFVYDTPSVYMNWYWGVEYYPSHRWIRQEIIRMSRELDVNFKDNSHV